MATHSSILAWEIPQTEEPDRLHSRGSQRVGPDLATKQQLGDSEGQNRLVCCSPRGHKESDTNNYIKSLLNLNPTLILFTIKIFAKKKKTVQSCTADTLDRKCTSHKCCFFGDDFSFRNSGVNPVLSFFYFVSIFLLVLS